MLIGTIANDRINSTQKHLLLGETSNDIWIEAPRIPYYHKNVVLAYRGDYIFESCDWNVDIARAVLLAESGGNFNAVNPKDKHRGCNGSYGGWQIGCIHFGKYGIDETNWHDEEINTKAACEIYKINGWKSWGAYTDGSYIKFL